MTAKRKASELWLIDKCNGCNLYSNKTKTNKKKQKRNLILSLYKDIYRYIESRHMKTCKKKKVKKVILHVWGKLYTM